MNYKPQSPNHTVRLHINELVLNGFPPQDRQRIAGEFQNELVRLISERGVPGTISRRGSISNIDAGTFAMASPCNSENAGAQIARSLYRSLGGR